MKVKTASKIIMAMSMPAAIMVGAAVIDLCDNYMKKNLLTKIGKWTLGVIAFNRTFDFVFNEITNGTIVKVLAKNGIIEMVEEDQNGGSEDADEGNRKETGKWPGCTDCETCGDRDTCENKKAES